MGNKSVVQKHQETYIHSIHNDGLVGTVSESNVKNCTVLQNSLTIKLPFQIMIRLDWCVSLSGKYLFLPLRLAFVSGLFLRLGF